MYLGGHRQSRWVAALLPVLLGACASILGFEDSTLLEGAGGGPASGAGATGGAAAGGAGAGGGASGGGGAAARYVDAVLADAPCGYWRLGDMGATAVDSSGSDPRIDGELNAPIEPAEGAVDAAPDGAVTFLGGAMVVNDERLKFTGDAPFTIEFWMKNQLEAREGTIVGQLNDPPGGSGGAGGFVDGVRTGWRVFRTQTGVSFERGGGVGDEEILPSNQLEPPAGVTDFAHVVATFDGTTMRLYVNGALTSMASAVSYADAPSEPFVVASRSGNFTDDFMGTVDEVAVYCGKALSGPRVQAHLTAGTAMRQP